MPLTKEQIQQRKVKIVNWLVGNEMKEQRRDFRAGNGFSVSERARVAIGEQVMPVTEYLRREGFKDGEVVGEYRVRINPASQQYAENFSFFLMSPIKEVPYFNQNGNRQTEILTWLRQESNRDSVRIFRDGKGFSVNERTRVNVQGETLPVTQWLKSEGIVDGAIIDGYRVRVNPKTEQYPENVSFFTVAPVVAIPNF